MSPVPLRRPDRMGSMPIAGADRTSDNTGFLISVFWRLFRRLSTVPHPLKTPLPALTKDPIAGLERPMALVAEDNIVLRESTVRRLEAAGISALPVGSFAQAAKALKFAPGVDVALLDVHLDPDPNRENKGGIEIARLLRNKSPNTQLIGYTSEGTLSPTESQNFDCTWAKGSLSKEDHRQMWNQCAEFARESFAIRQNALLEHEGRLRREYERELSEADVLDRLHSDGSGDDGYTAEGALGLSGYRIRLVSVDLHGKAVGRSRVFPVWQQQINESDTGWINLEVYGHPRLFASGRGGQEAIASLGAFIHWTHANLAAYPNTAAEEAPFRRFLDSLYGE